MDISSPNYFESLVIIFTATRNLPRIGPVDTVWDDNNSIPLYGFTSKNGIIQPGDNISNVSREGATLATRVLPQMTEFHLFARLQHGLHLMVVQKATSSEQMERVISSLMQYGEFASSLR